MITIAKCFSVQEALMLKSRLEASGLHPFLPDEFSMPYAVPYLIDTAGLKVQVPEEEVETARALLDEDAESD